MREERKRERRERKKERGKRKRINLKLGLHKFSHLKMEMFIFFVQ